MNIHLLFILLISNTIIYSGRTVFFNDLGKEKFPGKFQKISNENIKESNGCNYKKIKECILAFTAASIIFEIAFYCGPKNPSKEIYHLRGSREKLSQNDLYQIKKEDHNQEIIQKIHNLIHQYEAIQNNNQSWININETENHTI